MSRDYGAELDSLAQELTGAQQFPIYSDTAAPEITANAASFEVNRGRFGGFGGFEGADRYNSELALWTPANQSADAEVLPDKYIAAARTRDMFRNDAYVRSGGEQHRDFIVGSHYKLNAMPDYKALGLSREWAKAFALEVESKWKAYAEGPDKWLDASGRLSFTSMVRLVVLTYLHHQEFLGTAEWLRAGNRPYNTAVHLIDPDRMITPFNGSASFFSGRIRGGIERNKFGRPIAYHIHDGYPYEAPFTGNFDVRRVLARKPWGRRQVLHIMEMERIDQTRGISQLISGLKNTKMAQTWRDVTLQNAVVAGTYAATIESDLPSAQVFAAIGQGDDPVQSAIAEGGEFLAALGEFSQGATGLTVGGTRIPHLFPGTKLNMLRPGVADGVGQDFESSLIRYLAATMGMTYEELSRDLRSTNYSSIKAGMAMTHQTMQSRKAMVADEFANQCYALWLEEAMVKGDIQAMKQAPNAPNFFEGLNKTFYTNAEWYSSGKPQIDELKETQAAMLRLRSGLSTFKTEIARLHGTDHVSHFEQMASEKELMQDLDIDPLGLEDNTVNALSGATGDPTSDTGNNDGTEGTVE